LEEKESDYFGPFDPRDIGRRGREGEREDRAHEERVLLFLGQSRHQLDL